MQASNKLKRKKKKLKMKAKKMQKYQKKKIMNIQSPTFLRKIKLLCLMRVKMRKRFRKKFQKVI